MTNKVIILLSFLLLQLTAAIAQKPFVEGSVHYKVVFESADKKTFTGTYVFTFKGGMIRKELKLSNGFQDILIINTDNNSVSSLRTKNGKKYVIQLTMAEISDRQEKYKNFVLKPQPNSDKLIADVKAVKGVITYKDGAKAELFFNPDWYIDKTIAYERFPDARFLPLSYSYKDDAKGFTMQMEAEAVVPGPIESSLFRIPDDSKMITNEEYKQLSRE